MKKLILLIGLIVALALAGTASADPGGTVTSATAQQGQITATWAVTPGWTYVEGVCVSRTPIDMTDTTTCNGYYYKLADNKAVSYTTSALPPGTYYVTVLTNGFSTVETNYPTGSAGETCSVELNGPYLFLCQEYSEAWMSAASVVVPNVAPKIKVFSAVCKDGKHSKSSTKRSVCVGHHGVRRWIVK